MHTSMGTCNVSKATLGSKKSSHGVHVKTKIPGSVIEHSQHGHNAIGVAIGASDVAACGPNVVHGQSDPTSTL